jgi:PTS system nitrogen regulatory IIA component
LIPKAKPLKQAHIIDMNLASLLPLEAVLPNMNARDKKQALKLLAVEAGKLTELSEKEVYSVLMAREHLGCTAVGNGVAIPHGRFDGLTSMRVIFTRIDEAIDFGAADGRRVDLVCLLLTPNTESAEHLKALAVISRVLRDKELCDNIRTAKDAKSIHALLVYKREED